MMRLHTESASEDAVESESSVGNIDLWLEATSGSKGGRIVGLGSISRNYRVSGRSSSSSPAVTAQISHLNAEVNHLKQQLSDKEYESRQRAQQVKDLNAQMEEFRKQQMLIMQHLQIGSSTSAHVPHFQSPPDDEYNDNEEDELFNVGGDDDGGFN